MAQIAEQSLYEDCQTLIEKGHQNWKSFFSRWESFAKSEEGLPESELFSEPKKSSEKKKVKQQSVQRKSKVLPSVKCKKNQISRKKFLKRKRDPSENKEVEVMEMPGNHQNPNNENSVKDKGNAQLERILKSVFTKILKANKNEFQIFTILSQTISGDVRNSQLFHSRLTWNISSPLQSIPECSTDVSSVLHHRNTFIRNLNKRWSFVETQLRPDIREQRGYLSLGDTFPKFNIHQMPQTLPRIESSAVRWQTSPINLGIKNVRSPFLSSSRHANTDLNSLKWDSGLKSPSSVCRKINNEYFIKRSFPKMNITWDGKRFGNLCLRKRTNSVTLSMENSNFITPERKPPERKCFSENVLQRKRTCPSKLFFGNEEGDSESDDETGKQTPIIHCRKKLKTQMISEVVNSDSDDCESILDRVNVP